MLISRGANAQPEGSKTALGLIYNLRLGPVAQSVEQRIENPCVGGSIPPQATKTTRKGKEKPAIQKIAGFFTSVVFGSV